MCGKPETKINKNRPFYTERGCVCFSLFSVQGLGGIALPRTVFLNAIVLCSSEIPVHQGQVKKGHSPCGSCVPAGFSRIGRKCRGLSSGKMHMPAGFSHVFEECPVCTSVLILDWVWENAMSTCTCQHQPGCRGVLALTTLANMSKGMG